MCLLYIFKTGEWNWICCSGEFVLSWLSCFTAVKFLVYTEKWILEAVVVGFFLFYNSHIVTTRAIFSSVCLIVCLSIHYVTLWCYIWYFLRRFHFVFYIYLIYGSVQIFYPALFHLMIETIVYRSYIICCMICIVCRHCSSI